MLCFSDENSSTVHTVDVLREMDIALSMVTEADIAVLKEVTAMISQRAAYIVAAGLSLFWQYIHIYIHMPIGMLFQSITYLLVSGVLSSFNLLKRTYFYVILMWDERGPICYVIKGGSFFMLLKGTCFYVIKGDPEQRCICGPMDYNWAHCIFC